MTVAAPYRVLLIDDQEAIHEDYRKILGPQLPTTAAINRTAAALFDDGDSVAVEWEGFDLSSAMQGRQGLELVQRSLQEGRPYAVAFVDIRMPPGWDGVETVSRIWQLDPEILVVFCSAYSDYSWEEMVRKLGRNDRFLILKKPFDNVEVRQCAMALTERWSVSRTDVLTGLLNRRAFHGHLRLEWSRSTEKTPPLSCAMVDLDYFKRINDTLGHQAGDLVLKRVAELLKSQCRASDYLCRFGGEELCVLLPNADEDVAAAWAERARQAIELATVMVGDRAVRVTASFGVSTRLGAIDTAEQFIDRADQALIVAKKLGRNQVVRASAVSESGAALEKVRQHGALFQGVMARDVMTTPVSSLPVAATVGEATTFLRQLHINTAPVVDAEGKLVGVLSEKDLICILPNHGAWSMAIDHVMQRTFVSFDEDASLDAICDFLGRVTTRRVFIVRDGAPVGVVSQGSLLRWFGQRMSANQPAPTALVPAERERLLQSADVVAQCASRLSQSATGTADDPLAPVLEGMRKVQSLVESLLALPADHCPPLSLTDSDSFPMSALRGQTAQPTG
ncbi:MAG: diguanylate cyclase [Pirellulales bacterium]